MSDAAIVKFYNDIFSDLKVDGEEATEHYAFLQRLNPPPDKITKLRAEAFKVACNYLSEDRDSNVALLRTINFVVHAVEQTCLQVKKIENTVPLDEEAVSSLYKSLLDERNVDSEENQQLYEFFKMNPVEPDALVQTRALAFKIGCDYLSEDKDSNVKLLRCINVIVHAFELTFYQPKPFHLEEKESVDYKSLSLEQAVQQVWNLDVNRLTPGDDYILNVQKGKKPYLKEDGAGDPLFTRVDPSVWKRPTYSHFRQLLDNYIAETGHAETVTDAERDEVRNLLNAIYETAPMQFCHKYCHAIQPDTVPQDRTGFLKLLQTIWFDVYRREGTTDSSGFEHVFVGEVKNGEVSGLHNWIQMYLEEQKGNLDYRGYIKPRGKGDSLHDDNDYILSLQFSWKGVEKFVGTSFIGVSPEFEMALYTMCFLVGAEENPVTLDTGTDTFELVIKCYSMAQGKIGTTFPEVTSHYEE